MRERGAMPMMPRLLAVAGPVAGSTYILTDTEMRIGRDLANSIAIADLSLSRRHCVLSRESDGYKICDLESRSGTFVNGGIVLEKCLQHGDEISVGDSVFMFLEKEEAAEEPTETAIATMQFDDTTHGTANQIHSQDVLYLQPE